MYSIGACMAEVMAIVTHRSVCCSQPYVPWYGSHIRVYSRYADRTVLTVFGLSRSHLRVNSVLTTFAYQKRVNPLHSKTGDPQRVLDFIPRHPSAGRNLRGRCAPDSGAPAHSDNCYRL